MESFARLVTGKAKLVVLLWLVIAVASAPLFTKLSSVMKVQQYSLPPDSEAVKAEELLKSVQRASASPGIVIVRGFPLSDRDMLLAAARWGYMFNRTLYGEGLGSNPIGLPILLAEANRTLYVSLLANITSAAEQARKTWEMLYNLSKVYGLALENATRNIEMLVNMSKMIAQADAGYANATRGLEKLAEALLQVSEGLAGLDLAYVNATNQLLELAAKLNETADLAAAVDRVYVELVRAAAASGRLAAALSNRSLVSQALHLLAVDWWQAARTYKVMEACGGNYTCYLQLTNLSMAGGQAPPPLPREEAEAVWAAVRNLVEKGVNVDEAALSVALGMVNKTSPEAAALAAAVSSLWLERLHEHVAPPAAGLLDTADAGGLAERQLQLLAIALQAADEAAAEAVEKAAEIAYAISREKLVEAGVPPELASSIAAEAAEGKLNHTIAALAAVKLVEAKANLTLPPQLETALARLVAVYDPEAQGTLAADRDAALEAAARLVEQSGAPAGAVEAALRLLRSGSLSRGEAAAEALKLIRSQVNETVASMLEAVAALDPEATGALASNRTLLAQAAAKTVYEGLEASGQAPPGVDEEVVERLARLVIAEGLQPREAAARLALDLTVSMAAEKVGPERAEALKNILLRYDPEAQGTLASNETLALEAALSQAPSDVPLPEPEKLLEMARNETALRLYVLDELRSRVLSQAPPEARPLLEAYIKLLEQYGPQVPPEETWRLIEDYFAQMLVENLGLEEEAARKLASIVTRVARGEASPEEEAARLAEEMLVEQVAPAIINETKGMLVSRHLDGFIVMFSPSGETSDERAGNVLRAADEARRLLAEVGVENAKVLASGSDLVMKDVREYAIKDAEKTSKISETATFIVLLLILESVFAVVLPYIGIILGLLVGGALVYLAAKQGIITLDSTAHSLMMTTALGLGADYAAYLVHRFREELARGYEAREAARRSLARAGPAVLASALTVMIGFGSLLLGWDLTFLRGIGETIPVTVAATAAASLTLVPALLTLVGGRSWFWWPRRPRGDRHVDRESRIVRALHRHAAIVLTVLIVLILVSGYFYITFKGSHDMKLMLPSDAPSVKAFEVLRQDYMPGVADPLFVVLKLPGSLHEDNASRSIVETVAKAIAEIDGVGKVVSPLENPALASSDGRVASIQVVLAVDPYSEKGVETVEEVHETAHRVAEAKGAEVYVGGSPYAVIEMEDILYDRFYHRIIPAAAVLMVLVFTLIFGSLPASLAALAVIIGAAFIGITMSVVVFKWILGKDVPWFLNVVSLVAVMGVGMDYNSFFLARALEECRRHGCRDTETPLARAVGAVGLFIIGLSAVVSSAYFSLLGASNVGMQAMGFTLGVTILTAGVMAGYLFTPLIIALLGEHAWKPWGMKKRIEH